MSAHESTENYLETILVLSKDKNRGGDSQTHARVRSVDIAKQLGFTKPSVSIAMKKLRENGLIVMDNAGYITLTKNGQKIAETIYKRHMLISKWLISLGVDQETAIEDACKMEHDMSEQSFMAIQKHIENWKR